jgi:hypothetical protein
VIYRACYPTQSSKSKRFVYPRSPLVNPSAGGIDITKAEIVDIGTKYKVGEVSFTGAIFTHSY